jgi:hypothetical protein
LGRIPPHPAVFIRVANKELTGYGTWKSAETAENKELIFALSAHETGSKAREVRAYPPHPHPMHECQKKGLTK